MAEKHTAMASSAAWLAGKLGDAAGPTFASLTGLRIRSSVCGETPPEELAGFVTWRQELDAAPGAALLVAAGPRVWRRLGQHVLTAAGLDEASDAEVRDTYLEALQQALSVLPQTLGQHLGREVALLAGGQAEFEEDLGWTGLRVEDDEEAWGNLFVSVNGELAEVLVNTTQRLDQGASAGAAGEMLAKPAPAQLTRRAAPGEGSKTLDLLLEVELPVGVSFGRTQMKVKDAIKLTTGSIVELNRSVSAPVEIVVNNCVIARGEVVVVEGNYGVRIQEIVSREERLRTLF